MSGKEKCNMEQCPEKVSLFLGKLVSFNNALKLYHWHVVGKSSYAQHIAIDQALVELRSYTDSIAEISYAICGSLDIIIPKTKIPPNIIEFVQKQIKDIEGTRKLYSPIFMQSMLDDFQQTLEQLIFRLKRLS